MSRDSRIRAMWDKQRELVLEERNHTRYGTKKKDEPAEIESIDKSSYSSELNEHARAKQAAADHLLYNQTQVYQNLHNASREIEVGKSNKEAWVKKLESQPGVFSEIANGGRGPNLDRVSFTDQAWGFEGAAPRKPAKWAQNIPKNSPEQSIQMG